MHSPASPTGAPPPVGTTGRWPLRAYRWTAPPGRLRLLADSEPLRPGEPAARLGGEASHVTRAVQQPQKSGYVARVPGPDDRRAQRIELTGAGAEAIAKVRDAGVRGMQMALSGWSPGDLRRLATLFHRRGDDFLACAEQEGESRSAPGGPA